MIRFVQLRKPLREVLENFDPDPLKAARMLRDFVESQTENLFDDRWRIRVLNQHDLWKVVCFGPVAGVGAGLVPAQGRPQGPPLQEEDAALKGGATYFQGEYQGGKWGIYLRAPDNLLQAA